VAGGAGALAAGAVDSGGRSGAAAALATGLAVVAVVSIGLQWLLRAPELRDAVADLRGARG
jgi:hypothetical protein